MSNDTEALSLSGFLRARIAEDEGDAHYLRNVGVTGPQYGTVNEVLDRMSARVLAECEAKLRIIAAHQPHIWHAHTRRIGHPAGYVDEPRAASCVVCDPDGMESAIGCPTLRYLAAVYADHPDYRDYWRPSA